MVEHPTTSIEIDPERQDDESTIGSIIRTVFTTKKIPVMFTIMKHNYLKEANQP